jgi:GT2 family glycosyltransferase
MRISIIITTLSNRINYTLESLCGLRKYLNYELIVIRNIYNASKARNLGVAKATSDIIAILDDDLKFNIKDFIFLLSKLKKGKCVWSSGTQIMYRSDFISVGGFNERVFKVYQEDMEFLERLKSKGLKVEFYHEKIKHLGGQFSWNKLFLIRFNTPLVLLEYKPKMLLKVFIEGFFAKHPLRWLLNFAFIFGLFYHMMKLQFSPRNSFGW